MKVHRHFKGINWLIWSVVLGLLGFVTAVSVTVAAGFVENWDAATSSWFELFSPGGSLIAANHPDPQAEDGKVLELRLAAGSAPGPGNGPETQTLNRFGYGTYSTRLKTADCSGQPNAGVVTGYFVYFNDGQDANGNELPDNVEIDFEWLCAEPQVVYLTMWTDYRDSDEAQKRVSRAINLQSGTILYTCYFESFGTCQSLNGAENQPAAITAIPDYDSSQAYIVYGFDWSANRVTWWMTDPASEQKIILWDYLNQERIPPPPAYYFTNLWHTANWTPDNKPEATQSPTVPVSVWVDWTRFEPSGLEVFLPLIQK